MTAPRHRVRGVAHARGRAGEYIREALPLAVRSNRKTRELDQRRKEVDLLDERIGLGGATPGAATTSGMRADSSCSESFCQKSWIIPTLRA
jgi:hypothetical protein